MRSTPAVTHGSAQAPAKAGGFLPTKPWRVAVRRFQPRQRLFLSKPWRSQSSDSAAILALLNVRSDRARRESTRSAVSVSGRCRSITGGSWPAPSAATKPGRGHGSIPGDTRGRLTRSASLGVVLLRLSRLVKRHAITQYPQNTSVKMIICSD